jgi:solute carrier family 32 (vesicular inhibitory amino acid transporter)
MSNSNNHTTAAEGRQARSFSQGSAGSYLNSWLSGRFSPSTSANYLEGDNVAGDLEDDDDEAHHGFVLVFLSLKAPAVLIQIVGLGKCL